MHRGDNHSKIFSLFIAAYTYTTVYHSASPTVNPVPPSMWWACRLCVKYIVYVQLFLNS